MACPTCSIHPRNHQFYRLLILTAVSLVFVASSLFAESEIMQLVGKNRADILKQWGPPFTTAYTEDREILTYPQGRVFLSKGIVVEVGALLEDPSSTKMATKRLPQNHAVPARPVPLRPAQVTVSGNSLPTVSTTTFVPVRSPIPAPPVVQSQHRTGTVGSPYDEPPTFFDLVMKPFLKICVLLAVFIVGMAALKIWVGKLIARRRDPYNPTGVFPSKPPKREPVDGVFPSSQPPPLHTQLTAKLLDEMDWLLFEDLTAEYFRQEGYRADLTRMGADGGVDIYLHRSGESRPFAYVQCKAWGSRQVGVEPMRALFGVMAAAGIKEGHFACTGEFSSDAQAFAQQNNIQLITGELLIARFNRCPESERVRILSRITQGDYTTPSCPKCGTKMVTKDFSGRDHWCCPRYPKCRSKPIAVRKRPADNHATYSSAQ